MLYPVDANFSRRRLLWDLFKQWPRVGDLPFVLLGVLFRAPVASVAVGLVWVALGLWLSPLVLQLLFLGALFIASGILGGRWGGVGFLILLAGWAFA